MWKTGKRRPKYSTYFKLTWICHPPGHVHTNSCSRTSVLILSKSYKKICMRLYTSNFIIISFSTIHSRPRLTDQFTYYKKRRLRHLNVFSPCMCFRIKGSIREINCPTKWHAHFLAISKIYEHTATDVILCNRRSKHDRRKFLPQSLQNYCLIYNFKRATYNSKLSSSQSWNQTE